MKLVAGPRKELGVRTIFNMYEIIDTNNFRLGPLTNPAKPKRMVVGVFSKDLGSIMAKTLILMGVERGWVVCGDIGLDEVLNVLLKTRLVQRELPMFGSYNLIKA